MAKPKAGQRKRSGTKRPAKHPGGRPRKKADADQIRKLAAIGCTVEEIETVLAVSKRTLERRYAAAIAAGRNIGRRSLRRLQWAQAKEGNTAMLIWLGKQLLGQTNRILAEHSGPEGQPIQHQHQIDVQELTDDELIQLQAIQEAAAARRAAAERATADGSAQPR